MKERNERYDLCIEADRKMLSFYDTIFAGHLYYQLTIKKAYLYLRPPRGGRRREEVGSLYSSAGGLAHLQIGSNFELSPH